MTTPPHLRSAVAAVFVVAAVHVAALILIGLHVDVIRGSVAAAHPGIDAGRLSELTGTQVLSSVVPHVLLVVLLSWRAWRLRSGRPRTRIVVTILLAVQLLAHATLPTVLRMLPGYGGWVTGVQAFSLVFELAALWLLWAPKQVRAYFRRAETAAPVR